MNAKQAAKKQTSIQAIDQATLLILHDWLDLIKKNSANSVQKVLNVSSEFISKEAHKALKDFYTLYFSDKAVEATKQSINDNVSKLLEEAQNLLSSGGEAALATLQESEEAKKERLGVAALQKQLEALIHMEDSFRDQLLPVLNGMQFEDAMNQRLSHIEFAWTSVIKQLCAETDLTQDQIAREIADKLSSNDERKNYYLKVLHEEPPAGIEERGVWISL